ncbi:MAG: hypothetical protein NTV94_07650, partial [Planctomycetota bacterium]|nr:hypothetical protein [Planctomycetota bacterium]
MKALMTGIIVIAIANLLAIGGFVGWLVQTDRLDMERVRELRQKLAVTVTQDRADKAAQEKKDAAAAAEAVAAAKAAKPPLTASEQLSARLEATELDKERLSRLKREIDSLQKRLAEQADQIARDRAALERDRKAFADMSATTVETQTTEQFQKALGVLTSLKPAAAKSILAQMLTGALDDAGSAAAGGGALTANGAAPAAGAAPVVRPEQLKKVVQYLDAMEERPRTKIMTEFTKDDPALAGRLLAELR